MPKPLLIVYGGQRRDRARMKRHTRIDAEYRVLLSTEGKCLEPSDSFCGLLGYAGRELLGKPIDLVTAPNMIHIPKTLGVVVHFGFFPGLWMLLHRQGAQILVRYECELLPDMSIEMRMAVTGKHGSQRPAPEQGCEIQLCN